MARETVAALRAQLDAMTARALRAEKQIDQLTAALVKVTAPRPATKHTPREGIPDVERRAVERAERSVRTGANEAFVTRAKKDLEGKGFTSKDAEKEARRLLAEATDMQSPTG